MHFAGQGRYTDMKTETDMTREKLELNQRVEEILDGVRTELLRAVAKHGPMHSSHEAFGVIYEEFNVEFAEAMVANDLPQMHLEANQVAAMACRFMLDLPLPVETSATAKGE